MARSGIVGWTRDHAESGKPQGDKARSQSGGRRAMPMATATVAIVTTGSFVARATLPWHRNERGQRMKLPRLISPFVLLIPLQLLAAKPDTPDAPDCRAFPHLAVHPWQSP